MRFLRAEKADLVEQVIRLPEGESFELPLRLDIEGDTDTLSGLEVRAPPPVARPKSMVKPPIPLPIALSSLGDIHFSRGVAARNGDCFPLSVCSGFEISDAWSPRLETLDRVTDLRSAAVDLLCGDSIGGVPGRVFREMEGLPIEGEEAAVDLADWKQLGHWRRDG